LRNKTLSNEPLQSTLQALAGIYKNSDGPSGAVCVKYGGDKAVYQNWAPRRL